MVDSPCVIAPPTVTVPVCLECLTPLSRATHVSPCPRCSAPLCDTCHFGPNHAIECEMFVEANVKINMTNFEENDIFYACILPLRMWREGIFTEKDSFIVIGHLSPFLQMYLLNLAPCSSF